MKNVMGFQVFVRRPDASAMSAQAAPECTMSSARSGVLAGHSVHRADGGSGDIGFPDHSQIRRDDLAAHRPIYGRQVIAAISAARSKVESKVESKAHSKSQSKAQIKELLGELSELMRQSAPIAEGVAFLEKAQSEAPDQQVWKHLLIEQINAKFEHRMPLLGEAADLDRIVDAMYGYTLASEYALESRPKQAQLYLDDFIVIAQSTPNKVASEYALESRPKRAQLHLEDFIQFAQSTANKDCSLVLSADGELALLPEEEALGREGSSARDGAERQKLAEAFIRAFYVKHGDLSLLVGALPSKVLSAEALLTADHVLKAYAFLQHVDGVGMSLSRDISNFLRKNRGISLDSEEITDFCLQLETFNNESNGFGLPDLVKNEGGYKVLSAHGASPQAFIRLMRDKDNAGLNALEFKNVLYSEYGFEADEKILGYNIEDSWRIGNIDFVAKVRSKMDEVRSQAKLFLEQLKMAHFDRACLTSIVEEICSAEKMFLPCLAAAFKLEFGKESSSSTAAELAGEIYGQIGGAPLQEARRFDQEDTKQDQDLLNFKRELFYEYGFDADEKILGYKLEDRRGALDITLVKKVHRAMNSARSRANQLLNGLIMNGRTDDLVGVTIKVLKECRDEGVPLPCLAAAFEFRFGRKSSPSNPVELAKDICRKSMSMPRQHRLHVL